MLSRYPKLRRKSLRYRKKSLVILAIICISSSTIYKLCLVAERFYQKHYVLPEVKEFEFRNAVYKTARIVLTSNTRNSSHMYINNLLTTTRIRHQLRQDMLNVKCSDSVCSILLTPLDRSNYETCTKSAAKRGPIQPEKCLFLNGTNRRTVGLASFPGSGNTWVRGMLQKVTGFCTGSLYCDRDLRRLGFPGESITSSAVLVTKTHKPRSHIPNNSTFHKVIFIVRDPFKAIISEWNRRLSSSHHNTINPAKKNLSSHVFNVGQEYFGSNSQWIQYVEEKIKTWTKMVNYWIMTWSPSNPLHVVKYEDLVENKSREISHMLRFIGVYIEEDDVRDKLQTDYSAFHRKRHGNFTHYTTEQVALINSYLQQTQIKMAKIQLDTKFNLSINMYMKSDPI